MVFGIALPCVLALGTLVWFAIGGIKDMVEFFRALRTMKRDSTDDGRVAPAMAEKGHAFEVIEKPEAPPAVAPTTK
jgi:hypothetical protein